MPFDIVLWVLYVGFFCLSYRIGGFSLGLWISNHCGKSLHLQGSGNVGATNAFRVLGLKVGLITLVFDVFKGILAIRIAYEVMMFLEPWHGKNIFILIHPSYAMLTSFAIYISAFAVVLGHIAPYKRAGSGKGVATALGCLLYIQPYWAIMAVLFFIALIALSRLVSYASLGAVGLLWWMASCHATPFIALHAANDIFYLWLQSCCMMIIARHYENIMRLFQGEEKSL